MSSVKTPTVFSRRLEDFLCIYAPQSVGASPNTLASYSYTFVKYLSYREIKDHISPDSFELDDLTADSFDAFPKWLEGKCAVRPSPGTSGSPQYMLSANTFQGRMPKGWKSYL